jgi:hypothetical protein
LYTQFLWAGSPEFEIQWGKSFPFSISSRLAPGLTKLLIQWVRGFFSGGKAAREEVDPSPPFTAEVKKQWNYYFYSPFAFMMWTEALLSTTPYLSDRSTLDGHLQLIE